MTEQHDDQTQLNSTDARAGRPVKHMRVILGVSTVAAVVVLLFVFGGFAAFAN